MKSIINLKTEKRSRKLKIGILILILLTILTTPTLAKFIPAQQIDFQTYRTTINKNVDYCVITSQNVIEISRETELKEGYKAAWENAEDRNVKLERETNLNIWYFIGGFALGAYIAK